MAVKPMSVDGAAETKRFSAITFDDFRKRAQDASLSPNEKIGYPEAFREGFTDVILQDIAAKLPAFADRGRTILDIGMGCGELSREVVRHAAERGHRLVGVDSEEMLANVADAPSLTKVAGRFPDVAPRLREIAPRGFDAVLCYGVLQCIFEDASIFRFLDEALMLLAPGGRLLVGELANISKLRRFLASENGAAYHRAYMRTSDAPDLPPFVDPGERMDDGTIFGLVLRARTAGYDGWIVPQPDALPLSNRREDLLFARP